MFLADKWQDYEVLDCGGGEKLERWGDVYLRRPDPQAIWPARDPSLWRKAQAHYHRSDKGGGSWEFFEPLPDRWVIGYRELKFYVRPTGFKHTGLFPEQAVNWDWMSEIIKKSNRPIKVLNLFAYTGAATISASKAGASEVVHLDAAKGMVNWAKENMVLNNLQDHTIRFIVDDALKFVKRELNRGHSYQIILMDPPSYGRGPNNELWKIEDKLEELIGSAVELLADDCVCFLVNGYTTGFSPIALDNIMRKYLLKKFPDGTINTVELALPIKDSDMLLPCGISSRFER